MVYCGLDVSTGDFVTIKEWKLIASSGPSKTGKTLQWADSVGQDVPGKLLKQVTNPSKVVLRLLFSI